MPEHRLTRRRLLTLALQGAAVSAAAATFNYHPDSESSAPKTRLTYTPPRQTPAPSPTPPPTPSPSPDPTPSATPAPPAPTTEPTPAPVPGPTLEVKVGQMLMMGFTGTQVSAADPIARAISEQHLGGIALFGRNIQSPAQLTQLTSALQSFADRPLLIATDQEGGQVARLNPANGFPSAPSARSMGPDVTSVHEHAFAMATTLRNSGINTNLAPVCDVDVNPYNPIIARYGRSFSSDPQTVAAHALEFVRAHHEAGVLTTLKHFPGHGSSTADSHAGFVDVTGTWSEAELAPFADIITAGGADLVMIAHIYNANLDPNYPASLSHATVNGLLRDRLGFGGVVLSDAMEMGAIAQNYTFEDAVVLAVNAGVDILAYANNADGDYATFERARDTIITAAASGTIAESRIDNAFQRITALKSRLTPAT